MADRFGEIPGIPVGTTFTNRVELARAGVHRPLQKGIAGSVDAGAESL